MWKRWLHGVVGVAALFVVADVVCVTLLFACSPTPYGGRHALHFSSEAWRAAANDAHGARCLMLDDIVSRHELVGMTRAKILELLGPMQPPGYPIDFGDCYYLGPADRVISVDNDWLILEFHEDFVTGYRVAMD